MAIVKEGQKVLSIDFLAFYLPEDFDGTIADALECLADYCREDKSQKITNANWHSSLENFARNKRLTADWGLHFMKDGKFNLVDY